MLQMFGIYIIYPQWIGPKHLTPAQPTPTCGMDTPGMTRTGWVGYWPDPLSSSEGATPGSPPLLFYCSCSLFS